MPGRFVLVLLIAVQALCCTSAVADGIVVDKVYHPYVLPNEREIEWRLMSGQTEERNVLGQRIAYGHALSETLMVEAYIVGEKEQDGDFGLQGYELELRWMLTEQGEKWADYGALFEIEKQHREDAWEATAGLLFEKEFGKTSLTMNAFAIYEWGENIADEWESEFRLQYRYRWIPQLQPALELYSGEEFFGLGPAFLGIQRFSGQKQLKWEAGFITELSHPGKNHTLRIALEFEF
ncbi:hypothetical protein [Thalassotalea mangrovi]|uniref:Copper resistance protein B n=1 Tax=Thalassotalea mangrovi TaxID=2572245 RepID=A0A4U1B6H1_9GAMM|nr:hypothetical protein [Thalassotalea mangrovi]TKB45442.1 hypothetical protein E8M12_08480 [Thalassotalea mangrovi]